jgi:hypothetical protein
MVRWIKSLHDLSTPKATWMTDWLSSRGQALAEHAAPRAPVQGRHGRHAVRSLGEAQRNPGHSSLNPVAVPARRKRQGVRMARKARHASLAQRAQSRVALRFTQATLAAPAVQCPKGIASAAVKKRLKLESCPGRPKVECPSEVFHPAPFGPSRARPGRSRRHKGYYITRLVRTNRSRSRPA